MAPFVLPDPSVHDELRVEVTSGERPGYYKLYASYVPPIPKEHDRKGGIGALASDVEIPFTPYEMRASLSELTSFARSRSGTSAPLTDVQHLGALLFDRLLGRNLLRLYTQVRDAAAKNKRGFRLRLAFPPSRPDDDASAIEHLPWELLYDPDRKDFVALSPGASIVRTRLDASRSIVPASGPPMILAVATEVSDRTSDSYGSDEEIQILTKMAESHDVHVQPVDRPSEETLLSELASTTAQVVHFCGTAEDEGREPALLLPARDGDLLGSTPRRVSIARVVEALASAPNVQLVFISGCDSLAAASALLRAVPAVVGFRDRGMGTAFTVVAQAFYDRLLSGDSLDVALAESRKRADRAMAGQSFWTQEVLYLSSPSGDWVWPREGGKSLLSTPDSTEPPAVAVEPPGVQIARERRRILSANRDELEKRRARLQSVFNTMPDFLKAQLDETNEALAAVEAELVALHAEPAPGGQ